MIIHCKRLITTGEKNKIKFSSFLPPKYLRYVQNFYCGIQTPSFRCPKSFGIKGRIPVHYFLAISSIFFSFISCSLFLKASRSFFWRRQKCNFHHRFFSLPNCTVITSIAAKDLPALHLEVERCCSAEKVARKQLGVANKSVRSNITSNDRM